jgi:isoleucyl-tRNA synthetase
MLATLGGLLALPLGLLVLLLPLLAPELSRPRDSAWGAVLLLLGLDLVTSADRLTGAPMLGVLCGALLIGRLGLEVGQGRWRQLTEEERQRLGSLERWSTSFRQLGITSTGLLQQAGAGIGRLGTGFGGLKGGGERAPTAAVGQGGEAPSRSGGKRQGKRWVRPESPVPSPTADAAPELTTAGPSAQLPAPEATDQASEPSAPHGLAEPESPSPTAAPDPATAPPSSSELESGA